MRSIKVILYQKCLDFVEERIRRSQSAIAAAREAGNEETKSSAGDKYETGRAMMQLEVEKNSEQLAQSNKLKQALAQVNPEKTSGQVDLGALVKTDKGIFYVAIPAGQLAHEGETYFAVSMASPIGKAMEGKKAQENFELNGKSFQILDIS